MKTVAVNLHNEGCDVYVARGQGSHMNNTAVWEKGWLGNPYPLSRHSREESVARYHQDFHNRLETDKKFADAVRELKGKRLGCFCAPQLCHAQVIADYLNGLEE